MDLATALNPPPQYHIRHKQLNDYKSHTSAFHPVSMPSPPELLHDSEEDDDSTGSTTPSLPHHFDPLVVASAPRKSTPHRSPPAVKDVFQASAVDKSVVFQLDVRSHPFFPAVLPAQGDDASTAQCPDCKLNSCCGLACTSRVICGESLLTALRKRVIQARTAQTDHRRRMPMHHHRRQAKRKTTHITIPKTPSSRSHSHRAAADQNDDAMSYNDDDDDDEEHHAKQVHHRPWLDDVKPSSPPRKRSRHETPSSSSSTTTTTSTTTTAAAAPAQQQQQQQHHHASSGRPSRVKGPCQACQESSDGCMRKAFNWPFPTSSIYNDKGKKFVYLCNKCGLRYNKSGGCVCRHCRWVFCKEEKRKAMQHIEQMIRSRPDGKVDPDEDIENFVCTPKYWTCGRPWKVGWVLQNGSTVDEDDDEIHEASSTD